MLDFTIKQKNRAVLGFLLPLMLSGGFQHMYAVINAAILGRTASMEAVAVAGACSTCNSLISNLFGGMASGAGFYFCRCVGSGQKEQVKHAFAGAFCILLLLCLPAVLSAVFPQPVLYAANVPGTLWREACAYLRFLFMGAFFVGLKGLLVGIVQSYGNSRVPGCLAAASVVMQTFLTLFFSSFLKLGAKGSAAAVLFNNLLFCIILGFYCQKVYKTLPFLQSGNISRNIWRELWRNIHAKTSMMMLLWLGTFVFQRQVNRLPKTVIAADTYVTAINNVCMEIVFAYGTAALVATGQNYGSRERFPNRYKEMIRYYNRKFLIQGTAFSVSFLLLFEIGGETLIRWAAGKEISGLVADTGAGLLRIIGLAYPALAVLLICRCALQSMGQYRIQIILGGIAFLISFLCSRMVVSAGAPMIGICIFLKLLIPGGCAGLYYWRQMNRTLEP